MSSIEDELRLALRGFSCSVNGSEAEPAEFFSMQINVTGCAREIAESQKFQIWKSKYNVVVNQAAPATWLCSRAMRAAATAGGNSGGARYARGATAFTCSFKLSKTKLPATKTPPTYAT